MSIKKQALYNILGRFFEFLITIGTPIILVRVFSKTDYGLYQQGLVVTIAIATLIGFNFSHNLFYFFPLANSKKEKSILLSHTYFILLGIGLFFSLLIILIKPFIFTYIKSEFFESIFWVIPFLITFSILNNSFDNFFVIEGKAKIAMFYYGTNKFVRGIFVIGATLIFNTPSAALWAIVCYLMTTSTFFYIYLSYHYQISPIKFDKQLLKKQFKYALPFGLSGIVGTIGNYADKLIITSLLPAKDMAIYAVGNFKMPFIELLYTSVGNVVLPEISKFSREIDGKIKAFKLWKKMVTKNIVITIPVLVYASYFAVYLITFLFGDQYRSSANVFRILILMFAVQMFGFGYILRGFGITKPIFPSNLAKMITSVVLGIVLTYFWGYIGVAISFIIAFSLNGIIQLTITKKILQLSWNEFIPWKDFLKILLISFISLVLSSFVLCFKLNSFFVLASSGIIYFSTIYIFLYKLNYLPSLMKFKSFFQNI